MLTLNSATRDIQTVVLMKGHELIECITPITATEPLITQESFLFGKDYGNCYCEFWGCDNGHICPRDL
jgi:hypothetical protein